MRTRLAAVLVLVVAASVLSSLGPVALKLVVDGLAGQSAQTSASPVLLIALYVSSQWLSRTVGEARGLLYARVERRMYRTLSERLFAHLMQLPLRFHLDRSTGGISQALNNGLQGYQMIMHHLVFTFLPVTAELGTLILVLFELHQPVFLELFCAAIAAYAAAFAYAAMTISRAAGTASAALVDANAAMTDGVLNYETVKYFTAESTVLEKLSRALSRTESEWVAFYRRYALNGIGVATIFGVFLATTIGYAAREVGSHRMTLGDFVLINSYMLQLVRPVEMLGYAMQGLSQGIAMLQKMLALFREPPEPQVAAYSRQSSAPAAVRFEGVTLAFQPRRSVLREINLNIPAGSTLGIVGASGSGKSTIVRLLVRLFEPDTGRILLDDIAIRELPLDQLRRWIAVVPQDAVLFDDTIGYNIGFGAPGSTYADVEEAARLARVHEFILSLPDKYDTRVGERGLRLSGGERQRVAIARAVIRRPRIYVFDEATSSLDSHTEREIVRSLRAISRCSTTLVIAHRLSTVVHADEIVVVEDGRIVEKGTHSSLLREHGLYRSMWESQLRGSPDAQGAP